MQEQELRLDMLSFLDDIDSALVTEDIKTAREDIKEYREYLINTTKISATAGTVTQK